MAATLAWKAKGKEWEGGRSAFWFTLPREDRARLKRERSLGVPKATYFGPTTNATSGKTLALVLERGPPVDEAKDGERGRDLGKTKESSRHSFGDLTAEDGRSQGARAFRALTADKRLVVIHYPPTYGSAEQCDRVAMNARRRRFWKNLRSQTHSDI